jgi:hypothetical protein
MNLCLHPKSDRWYSHCLACGLDVYENPPPPHCRIGRVWAKTDAGRMLVTTEQGMKHRDVPGYAAEISLVILAAALTIRRLVRYLFGA